MKKTLSAETLIDLYQRMLRIRRFEEKIVEVYPAQEMKSPVHLYIGQEAVAAGVCANLRKEDYVFATHRSHGTYIAKGGDMGRLAAELYGKATGCSKGKGGSMHVVDPEAGVMGSSAIVGGNLPLSVGAALGLVMQGRDAVCAVFFGDGAADGGVFHESLNFAALKKLPVLFICENNLYATCSPQLNRQPQDNIYKRGEIYSIPGIRIDGNDVTAVSEAAEEAIERARRGEGSSLIECRTYRWKAHVGAASDIDLGYRSQEELDEWMARCPVKMLEGILIKKQIATESQISQIGNAIDKEIEAAFRFGQESPYPEDREVLEDVLQSN